MRPRPERSAAPLDPVTPPAAAPGRPLPGRPKPSGVMQPAVPPAGHQPGGRWGRFGQRFGGVAIALIAATATVVFVVSSVHTARNQYTGSVALPSQALNFSDSGRITAILVHVGQHVTKGEVVARIDPTAAEQVLAADRSDLEADQARVTSLTGKANAGGSVAAAKAGVLHDQNQLLRDRAALALTQLTATATGVITAVPAGIGDTATPSGVRTYDPQLAAQESSGSGTVSLDRPAVPRDGTSATYYEPVAVQSVPGPVTAVVQVPEADVHKFGIGRAGTIGVPAAGVLGLAATVTARGSQPVRYHGGVGYDITFSLRRAPSPAAGARIRTGMSADLRLGTR